MISLYIMCQDCSVLESFLPMPGANFGNLVFVLWLKGWELGLKNWVLYLSVQSNHVR